MDTSAIHEVMMQAWTDEWSQLEAELARELSPASSGRVLKQLLETVRPVAVAGFRAWLLRHEHPESTLVRDGQKLRFKRTDAKKFLTPLGPVTVERRVFQHDLGGPTFVPIDAAWGMGGQTATPEVREAAAFAMGLMTAAEATQLLAKVALFRLGETSLKKLADQVGEWFETHPETVVAVREAEAIPEETKVLWASLDGTNVRLNEPGPKPGRPAAGDAGELAPTCYKNAMVGTVSC